MRSPFQKILLAAACLFLTVSTSRGQDVPTALTIDLPFQANAATPVWLGHPETPATTFAVLNLPIQPPDATSALLVTIFFEEKQGGFLRVIWKGTQGAETLSDNFYEGIGMRNQRSLLIAPGTLQGGGILELQSGDASLGVQRIKFQWLENRVGLVAPDIADTLVTPAAGTTQPAQVLDGQPPPENPPAWQGHLVNAPLTDTPLRIEQGVEFTVGMDSVPQGGRIVLKENGLAWGQHLVVWINRQRAGIITPAVPDLSGYDFPGDPGTPAVYVGWREGSVFIPVALLKNGDNAIQFSVEDDSGSGQPEASGSPPPLAVKDVVVQLSYPAGSDASASATALTPSPPPEATGPAADAAAGTAPDLSVPGAYSQFYRPTNTPTP